jgi:hypothetical protein
VGPTFGVDAKETRKNLPLPKTEPWPSYPYPVATPTELVSSYSCGGVRLSPSVLRPQGELLHDPQLDKRVEQWWNDNWQSKIEVFRKKKVLQCHLSNINPTWIAPRMNHGLRG